MLFLAQIIITTPSTAPPWHVSLKPRHACSTKKSACSAMQLMLGKPKSVENVTTRD